MTVKAFTGSDGKQHEDNSGLFRVRYRFSQGLLILLAFCFVIQVFSPLRLNTDAIVLLSMGESAAHGNGFVGDSGQTTVFPPGYPALLAVMLKLGLAHSWAIIGLNIVLLSVGIFATSLLLTCDFFTNKTTVIIVCAFVLLSFIMVKHVTIPLTDVPYFCCSMCCLAVMSQVTVMEWNWRFVVLVLLAWLLAVAAITVRRVGIALVPPLVFMIVCTPHFKTLVQSLSRRSKLIIGVVVTVGGGGTIYAVTKTSTLSDFIIVVGNSRITTMVVEVISYRFTELGEAFLNFPISEAPAGIHFIIPWIGIVLFILMLVGVATKRNRISPTEVYMACYIGILFMWPYYDSRFWLPVIPLVIAYSVLAGRSLKVPHSVAIVYKSAFATLGFVAIAYSTRISLAGSSFPDRYGDGSLRPTYCAAFQSCRDEGDHNKVDYKVLHLLREYE